MNSTAELSNAHVQAIRSIRQTTSVRLALLVGILAYLGYAFFAFDTSRVIERANMERFKLLALDSFFYKVHVERRLRSGGLQISIEGDRNQIWDLDSAPGWIKVSGTRAEIDLGEGYWVILDDQNVTFFAPDFGLARMALTEQGVETILPPDVEVPGWIAVSDLRFDARPTFDKRLVVNRGRIEVQRYFFGWENFWFGFHSELNGLKASDLIRMAFIEDRRQPEQSNAALIFNDFMDNPQWQHRRVMRAVYETFLMAFIGTMSAVILAIVFAFLAAENFTPSKTLRFAVRRVFDFVRSVDSLIWSLIFIRAFGLGPLTGALAIAITMFGELGKLFSEALEDLDRKQIEGVASTGASRWQVYRYGVFPQVLPIILSQTLYYFEVNVRSATIIGALGAGGIGLVLVQYMQTTRNWENVLWIIVLTILLVTLIDSASSWARRRLL
jgi:phosphonate transport system permease protein